MTQPYSSFQIAGNVYPLTVSSAASALYDADKTLFFALDFFAFVINAYVGPRFLAETAAVSLRQPSGDKIRAAVSQVYPYDPGPYLTETAFAFPLLAAWRTEETFTQKTASWEEATSTFQLLYVLPPLDCAQAQRIGPLLNAVAKCLDHKTTQSYDPAYTPPTGALGNSPWEAGFANIDKLGFSKANYGFLEGAGNLYFPAVRMAWEGLEKDVYLRTGTGPMAGFDITGDLVGVDGTLIDPFVQSAVSATGLAITSLSVATGSAAGGTSVTLVGSGFVAGGGPTQARVVFGAFPAASVTVTDSSHIVAVTPAMAGTGTVGVALTNPDGRMAVSPQLFTFT